MSSTAVQYAGALRHTGCTLSDLQHTADYLCAVMGCTVLACRFRAGEKGCAVPPARF